MLNKASLKNSMETLKNNVGRWTSEQTISAEK